MNVRTRNLLIAMATGFVVLVFFSLVLFVGRYYCLEALMVLMPHDWKEVTICPSGLLPDEGSPNQTKYVLTYAKAGLSIDPNTKLSAVQSKLDYRFIIRGAMGISLWDMMQRRRQFHTKGVFYYFCDKDNYLLLNERDGQIIYSYGYLSKGPDRENIAESKVYFAGPNGVSDKASASLGRFEKPIAGRTPVLGNKLRLYEVKQRRFYLIDYKNREVAAGPELPRGDKLEPVMVGFDFKGDWIPPEAMDVNGVWKPRMVFLPTCTEPNEKWVWFDYTKRYITVLDKSGQIYELDANNWSFRDVGFLPVPHSLFSNGQQDKAAHPEDLLSYQIDPVYYTLMEKNKDRTWEAKDVRYFGMCVSSLSREGTALAVAVFDPNGNLVYRGDSKTDRGISTASAVYSESPMVTTVLFLFENLQPPVFEIASFLCGNCIEPSAGHRTLFVLPNSFVGMLGRYNGTKFDKEVFLPLLMGPSLILSIWLAFRVRKDAKILGFSGTAKQWWTVGTIAFGLPAYITYRLTRPKETLVTCQNCGQLRRPDMEVCHRCGGKWEMPELTPPNWRICD